MKRGGRERTCPDCGKPKWYWYGRRCRACAYIARKNRTRPARPCSVCGRMFQPYPSALRRGHGKFCSAACYNARRREQEKAIEVTCTACGTVFRRKVVFLRRSKQAFCSPRCAQRAHRGAAHVAWRGGSDPNRGSGWARRAAAIRVRDRFECVRCGRSQEELDERLSVDHRIPWRYLPKRLANHPSNLVSLCRPCHSWKTHVEAKWLNGDVQAMQRYLQMTGDGMRCVHAVEGRNHLQPQDLHAIALARVLRQQRRSTDLAVSASITERSGGRRREK